LTVLENRVGPLKSLKVLEKSTNLKIHILKFLNIEILKKAFL